MISFIFQVDDNDVQYLDVLNIDIPLLNNTPQEIILRRGHVFENFIEAASKGLSKELNIVMIVPNGQPEVAEDFGGVLRDALS